jgi:hypothetical protein
VGGSEPPGGSHVCATVLINDAGNALERDADGLGELLEADLGLDPDDPDTDGDGLWDGFEVLGIRGAGLYPDQALPSWGADPRHKDVFVENDRYCEGGVCAHPLPTSTVIFSQGVADTCSGHAEHLDNSDGRPGFAIHVDNGDSRSESSAAGDWGGAGDIPVERDSSGKPTLPKEAWGDDDAFSPIRRGVFRYLATKLSGVGLGEIEGPLFIANTHDRALFIHELGHVLGATHAGMTEAGVAGDFNYKPNYVSVMNYAYSYGSPNPTHPPGSRLREWDPSNLRFSNGERRMRLDEAGQPWLVSLDPSRLDESTALTDFMSSQASARIDLEESPNFFPTVDIAPSSGSFLVDWDRSGTFDGTTRSDVFLGVFDPFEKMEVFQATLDFGPQLAVHRDHLYLLHVPEGAPSIHYRVWREVPGCDQENLAVTGCGIWIEDGVVPTFPEQQAIASQMSAVEVVSSSGQSMLFVFYIDGQDHLCALRAELGSGQPLTQWEPPLCRPQGLVGAPEAVAYQGKAVVFAQGPEEADGLATIRAVVVSPDQPSSRWQNLPVLAVGEGGTVAQLRSRHPPAFAVDPSTGALVGVVTTDIAGRLGLVEGAPDLATSELALFELPPGERFLSHPGPSESQRPVDAFSDHRPALAIELLPSGKPRWQLWAHYRSPAATQGAYHGLVSSQESVQDDPGRIVTAFTRHHKPVGQFRTSTEDQPAFFFSDDARNANLVLYRGKLRAAAAFDRWPNRGPGFAFMPLADGVFKAALRDVNDCEVFRLGMPKGLTRSRTRAIFHGMDDASFESIEAANRVRLPRRIHYLEPRPFWNDAFDPPWLFVEAEDFGVAPWAPTP